MREGTPPKCPGAKTNQRDRAAVADRAVTRWPRPVDRAEGLGKKLPLLPRHPSRSPSRRPPRSRATTTQAEGPARPWHPRRPGVRGEVAKAIPGDLAVQTRSLLTLGAPAVEPKGLVPGVRTNLRPTPSDRDLDRDLARALARAQVPAARTPSAAAPAPAPAPAQLRTGLAADREGCKTAVTPAAALLATSDPAVRMIPEAREIRPVERLMTRAAWRRHSRTQSPEARAGSTGSGTALAGQG
jgi:hypothetical protein